MGISTGAAELLHVANKPGLTETGGGHSAKGVDFQRWWAVLRMVEMEQAQQPDFLLLFETVQDVTELDSASTPTYARIYQVKKKDRGEWTWAVLTGTTKPPKKNKNTASEINVSKFTKVRESALGKLQLSLASFDKLPVEAYFISNVGCDIPLATGGNAATSMPCSLADLAPEHLRLLTEALHSLCAAGIPPPDLTRLKLKKVAIHPDSPNSHVIKSALDLLRERSPAHAGQAAAFVESLIMKISPLGRHTDTCASFEELVEQRGFSRQEFVSALSTLETIPDYSSYLEIWLTQLQNEGLNFMEITSLRSQASRVVREQLTGATSDSTQRINDFCDNWIDSNPLQASALRTFVEAALPVLNTNFSGFKNEELQARLLMRAIKKCVDPN
ncbi:DUF4297 domain-containing protein [Jinshanibacter sp. LJY008]|uniref:DUF4297 domain-containing protein n=1 Tax=Limnobaculum eriocheiris TaxID=2897391 RepID=A0A9X1MUE5_9GAMM|nr:dsDNA nuclease domain-containing protein [Limnobaculum eriocheiris]MCD1125204.1 DUF4297 domain-containing protein [Limnobaculum eriocheiris]